MLLLLLALAATSAGAPLAASAGAPPPAPPACAILSGPIEGCCGCTTETTSAVNARAILPLLHNLSVSTFFRYYRASLGTDHCGFGFAEGMCGLEECSVEHCCAAELPDCLRGGGGAEEQQPSSSAIARSRGGPQWDEARGEGGGASGGALFDEPGVWSEPPRGGEEEYYDLVASHEAFTGYGMGDAQDANETRVIWELLYQQPCLAADDGGSGAGGGGGGGGGAQCLEERVFYRLLSGLHASINTHLALTHARGAGSAPPPALAARHPLLTHSPAHLRPSLPLYVARVGAFPERTSNLYFAYIFVARAVARAGALLRALRPATGSAEEDGRIGALLAQLLEQTASPEGGLSEGFDESKLFVASPQPPQQQPQQQQQQQPADGCSAPAAVPAGLPDVAALTARHLTGVAAAAGGGGAAPAAPAAPPRPPSLLARYRERYRNISRILDCVGCPRCQLWGKLQFLGLGTAMKVLFAGAEARELGGARAPAALHLSRNEVVALVNVFHRLSISVEAVGFMRGLEGAARGGGSCSSGGSGGSSAAGGDDAAAVAAAAAEGRAEGERQWQRGVARAVGVSLARALAAALAVGAVCYVLLFAECRGRRRLVALAKKTA